MDEVGVHWYCFGRKLVYNKPFVFSLQRSSLVSVFHMQCLSIFIIFDLITKSGVSQLLKFSAKLHVQVHYLAPVIHVNMLLCDI